MYTILTLTFQNRHIIKQDVKWSSNLEIAYLQQDYKKLITEVAKCYYNYGQFNLAIRFIYDECVTGIKTKILLEIFNAYQLISLKKVSDMTGLR